ncbi:MAG: neutral zinc metallopeptidase [Dongiaceae bacterium]
MRWRGGRRSGNIEDRRGMGGLGGGGGFGGGLPGGFRFPGGGGGRGGIGGIGLIVVVLILIFVFKIDPTALLGGGPATQTSSTSSGQAPGDDELRDFVAVVLADTEDTWTAVFQEMNRSYQYPTLVLFTGAVQSACGYAQSAVGPFYCPGDQKVYLDLSFFQELSQRFGAPGDFAQAYVIAHEIGHHVQTLLGISEKVNSLQAQSSEAGSNELSVRMELQADCFSGVWANHANAERQILEEGDIEEALGAANAIGDDRLQQQGQGYVVPDSFTHGTSAQRVSWFKRGFASGAVADCDTFNASNL